MLQGDFPKEGAVGGYSLESVGKVLEYVTRRCQGRSRKGLQTM